MNNISYSACEGVFEIQVKELVRIVDLAENLADLYQTRIGTLYDEFNTEIPLRFGQEYNYLWSEETIKSIKEAAEQAATILNDVRM